MEGGIKFSIKMDCNWMLRGSPSGHATFELEEAEGGAVGTSRRLYILIVGLFIGLANGKVLG